MPAADDHDIVGVRCGASLHANAPRSTRTGGGCRGDSVEAWPSRSTSKRSPIDIAREAGELARRRRTEGVAIAATKSAIADIVTEADREVEALIRARLAAERPGDGFLGEESGAERGTHRTSRGSSIRSTAPSTTRTASRRTRSASRRCAASPIPDQWEALAGAVFSPATGELFHAARGRGRLAGRTSGSRSTPSRRRRARCSPRGSATTRRRTPAISPGSRG